MSSSARQRWTTPGDEPERAPGPDHLDVRGATGLAYLELDATRVHVDRLVLAAMELEAQLLAGAHEEELAQVPVAGGVDELVAPRLLDALDGHGEAVEVEEVRREVAHRAVIPQAPRGSQARPAALGGARRRDEAPWVYSRSARARRAGTPPASPLGRARETSSSRGRPARAARRAPPHRGRRRRS